MIMNICNLPNENDFYSFLEGTHISNQDHERVVRFRNVFKIKTMSYYHNLCLKTGVLLLLDVFEKFIIMCLKYHELDPFHYFSCLALVGIQCLKEQMLNQNLFQTLTYINSLKRVCEEVFLIFSRDAAKYMKS